MAEPVLNIRGYVAEGEIFIQTDPVKDVVVDYARLVRDFPSANTRVFLGSLVFPPEAMFASPGRLAGAGIVRDPDLAFNRPASFSSRKEIFLQNPAAITVYVNGQAAANFRLEAGRHTLGSFPFQTGLNDVKIEIREEGQAPRFEEFSVAFDSDLLQEDEYTWFAGIGTRQWTTEDPLATAFYRRGLLERLTLGLHLQAAPDAGIGGFESILASPFGSLKSTAGFSAGEERDADFAAGLQYRFSVAGRRLYPIVGLGARYTGKYYLTPETALRENPYSWTMEASANQFLPFRTGVNLSFAYRVGRDGTDDLASGTFGISKSFDDGFALNFTFGADSRPAGGVTFRGGVFLTSVPPRGRTSFHLSNDFKGSSSADFQVRPKKYIGSPGFSASVGGLPSREDAAAYARAGAQLNHELFESSLSDTLSRGANGSPEAANNLSWSLASSVVFADGLWGVSRPIRDGFAIVAPGKSLADKEILVNHGADFRLRTARQKMPVVLPNLQAYTTGTVHLNVPELPLEQQAEVFRRLLAPVYRTGYALVMETRPRVFGGGRLVYGDGTPVALQAGEVYVPGDESFESMIFYSDETGTFQFYDLVPGTYGVRMYMSRDAVQEFVIPEGAEGLFDIGNVRIPGTPP
jgi:outer membrane usher protein